jgi:hypothetical protein
MFLMVFSVPNASIKGVQVFFDTKNNGALPLDPAYPKRLNV